MRWRTLAVCASLTGAAGCSEGDDTKHVAGPPHAQVAEKRASAPMPSMDVSRPDASAAPAAPKAPAAVVRVRVPGDRPAAVVKGPAGTAPSAVFLPGVCSNAGAYLHSFPEAAHSHGGIVAIDGELPCAGSPGFRTFARNIPAQHARIEAALAAAGATAVPANGLTLIGYSQGASIAEDLARKYPERYARVVLIGSPADPSVARLKSARAVATMSCELDVPPRMRGAAKQLLAAGVPAAYFEMPACTHGLISEGERVFDEVFDWLEVNQRPPPRGLASAAVPIVGSF